MTILHIDSSILGEHSVTRQLTGAIRARMAADGQPVVYRDLVADPIPAFVPGNDAGIIDEFLAADTVIIGAPMYNFSLSSQLKNWIDHICVAGKTFRYTESGPEGLAGGKRVIIALSRGGVYSGESPAAPLEHLETYLTGVFGFLGVTPEFVIAEGVAMGDEAGAAAVSGAQEEIAAMAA